MAQHDFIIDNQSGLNFRTDLNNCLSALVSQSSGNTEPATPYAFMFWLDTNSSPNLLKLRNAANSGWITLGRVDRDNFGLNYFYSGNSAPSTTYAYMPWVDTNGASPIYKIRNAANSAWITIGVLDVANFGLLPLAGGTLSGPITFSNTDYITLPNGTTAQRPGSPGNGMMRFNTTLTTFEGYKNGSWGEIGGGGYVASAEQAITSGGTITTSTTDSMQSRPVKGNGGPQTASTTPFGTGGGWKDGTQILLTGTDDDNSLSLVFNDAAKGLVGNFSTIELTKYRTAIIVYNSTLDRFILVGGN